MTKTPFRELFHSLVDFEDPYMHRKGEQRDVQNEEGLTGISLCCYLYNSGSN